MRWTVIVALAAMGCGPKASSQEPKPPPPPPPETKPVVPAAVTVTATAVGELTAQSEVSEASLSKIFPGFELKSAVRSSEGQEMTVWELSRGGTLSLVVEPTSDGKVFRVAIVDAESTTPAGVKIGMTYADFDKSVPEHECFRLVEERADSVACYGKDASSVGYVFGHAARGYEGPPGTVPAKEAMGSSAVTEILWLPEAE